MLTWRQLPAQVRIIAVGMALAAVYFLSGKLGLTFAFVNSSATAFWPPTGIAMAMAILFGLRVWPAIFVGAFVVNFTTAGSVATSLGIAAGNTLEGVLGAYLVLHFSGGRRCFERPQDVFKFGLLAAVLATMVSASIGVASLALGGYVPRDQLGPVWLTWWLGDAGGALIVAPVLLTWSTGPRPRITWPHVLEAAALLACLLAVGFLVFINPEPIAAAHHPLEFLVVPVLIWAGLRFRLRETTTTTALLTGIVVAGTLQGLGPFATSDLNRSMLLVQAFMCVIALTSLALAATVVQRQRAEATVRVTEEQLRLIEERQQAEAALADAQAIAHLGSWEWDIVSDRVTWSEEMHRIYGLPRGEFIASYQGFLNAVHPEDRPCVDHIISEAFDSHASFDFFH